MTLPRTAHILGLLLLLVAALVPDLAAAQGVGQQPGIIGEQRAIIDGLSGKVDELERRIAADKEDDAQLVAIRLQLEELSRELLNSGVAFRPKLQEINSRLEQLGPPPAQGAPPEPDIVTMERDTLVAQKAEINAVLGVAEALSIRISTLIDHIATVRSDLFREQFTKRYELSDAFSSQLANDVSEELSDLYRAVSSWARFVFQFKFQPALVATLLSLFAAAVLLVGGRRLFARFVEPDHTTANPPYISRLSVAFWSTLLPALALGVFFVSTYYTFDYYDVLRGDIGVFLSTLFEVIGVTYCVHRLAKAALSPGLPEWRLIAVESGPARWLVRLATTMAVVIGINRFLSVVTDVMGAPLSLTIARSFLATMIVGVLLVLIGLVRPYRDAEGRRRPWPAWLRYSCYGLGALTMLAALFGFIGLAIFMSVQIVVTGSLLLTAYIGLLSSRAIGAEGGVGETAIGRWLVAHWHAEDTTLDQVGLAVSVAINLMIIVIFLPLILLLWGFQLGDIEGWAYTLATGFTVGTFSFSPVGIGTGLLVFAIGYFLTRWFQGWLDGSVMARGRVDTGVRNSIRTIVGYAGLALAALIALSAAGIDLSNLALIAGGLSLGIGFGLQNVVSNFVSGLILLAERPFKAGDWIVAGSVSGTVRKISVRATEIETFQRQTVILPNSELINSAVGNWTHRNKLGRIDIKVPLAYGSDVKRAHAVMTEIAQSHPMVLRNPEPFVLFVNFGAAALEFEMRFFLADILASNTVQNDIRFAILEAFAREGIEIPSTPRAPVEPPGKWPSDDEKAEAEFIDAKLEAEAVEAALKAVRGKGGRRRKPDPD